MDEQRAAPETQRWEADEARQQWDSVLAAVGQGRRVLLERDGVPLAALVSPQDLAELRRFETDRAERFKALDRTGEAFRSESPETIEREVAKALAEVRAEMRAEQQAAARRP